MASPEQKSVKVLSIDGGGIRGIIPAIVLSALQERLGQDLWQAFDLIAGTSTGGIIALGIGTACHDGQPYSPRELIDLYVQNGPSIFSKSILTSEKELVLPKYSPDALEETLAKFFGDTQFDGALTPLLISSYDLQGQVPFFFKSHRIAADPNYNWKVTAIARATSAAPTYFPPLHLVRGTDDYALVDGGVFVNNPAMAAYAEARSLYAESTAITVVQWAQATGRIRSPMRPPKIGDCWAGPNRSSPSSWTVFPRPWTSNSTPCQAVPTIACKCPICGTPRPTGMT
jgi:uncharacterized protein